MGNVLFRSIGLRPCVLIVFSLLQFHQAYSATPGTHRAPQGCIDAANHQWTPFERHAWAQICQDRPIALDDGIPQPDRRISYAFIYELSLSPWKEWIRDKALEFVDASLVLRDREGPLPLRDAFLIENLNARSIHFSNVSYPGTLQINTIHVDDDLLVTSRARGPISIDDVRGRDVTLWTAEEAHVHSAVLSGSLAVSSLRSAIEKLPKATRDSQLADAGRSLATITDSSIDHGVNLNAFDSVTIDHVITKGTLSLGYPVEVRMTRSSMDEMAIAARSPPKQITVSESTLGYLAFDRSAPNPGEEASRDFWPFSYNLIESTIKIFHVDGMATAGPTVDDYLTVIRRNETYNPLLYEVAARQMREHARYDWARKLLFYEKYDERSHIQGLPRALNFIALITTGYGQYPEIAIGLLLVIMIVFTFLFRSGSGKLTSGTAPRSWFVFTLDSFIPLLSLDKDFETVHFRGWRQYALYLAKILSVVLAIFVWRVLEKLLD
jgi:hypothetical protein